MGCSSGWPNLSELQLFLNQRKYCLTLASKDGIAHNSVGPVKKKKSHIVEALTEN